jgi:hypothetical protein
MGAERDSLAAVRDAGGGDAGYEQQLVRGIRAAAPQYCWESEIAGGQRRPAHYFNTPAFATAAVCH